MRQFMWKQQGEGIEAQAGVKNLAECCVLIFFPGITKNFKFKLAASERTDSKA